MQNHPLAGTQGIILGRLFRNGESVPLSRNRGLDQVESDACLASSGQYLSRNFWGQYVAFLQSETSENLTVFRDPSGALPCFLTRIDDAYLLFSDISDVAGLPIKVSVNDDYLASSIMLPQLQKTITGLNGVDVILPAEAATLTPAGKTTKFLWSPFDVAKENPIADRKEAAATLCEAVQYAVGALAGCYRSILHNIGGLDSSIVLSCLAKTGRNVNSLNFRTLSQSGDESYYAQKAAEHSGIPFSTHRLEYDNVDLTKLWDWNLQVSPMGTFDCTAPASDIYERARQAGADAIFYGVGGDNVFFQTPHMLPALDYLGSRSGVKDIRRVFVETSRYGNNSLSSVAWTAMKNLFRPAPCFDYVYELVSPSSRWPFANPDLLGAGPQIDKLHPLLIPPADMAKGKYLHILTSALLSVEYYDPWAPAQAMERIHPLLAQPVVEACLKIPTWIMIEGGVDRGLARKAFRNNMPDEVICRMSKSNPDDLYRHVYRSNKDMIRELLLCGELVRRRIVEKAPLEEALNDGNILQAESPAVMLELLNWEIWCQKWCSR